MRSRNMGAVLLAAVISAAGFAQEPQAPAKPPPEINKDVLLEWSDIEKSRWADAKPYLNDPLPELQAAVPELKGLKPALSQEQLSSILARAGEKCVRLLERMPNVISNEAVVTRAEHVRPWQEKLGYLLLSRRTPDGIVLEEYRTDQHGRALPERPWSGPFSQGFASMWVRLFPANQPESRFRYLGAQEMDGHETFVVAFAQVPGLVKFPAQFLLQGTRITILYQGVAWIDSSDYRIVRMREDLLAPRPDAYLQKFTAKVRFDEVHIAKAASSLWLPREAVVDWEFKGQLSHQDHTYSHYRLYAVKTTIVPG